MVLLAGREVAMEVAKVTGDGKRREAVMGRKTIGCEKSICDVKDDNGQGKHGGIGRERSGGRSGEVTDDEKRRESVV